MRIHGSRRRGDTIFTRCLGPDSRVFSLAEMLVVDLMSLTASKGLNPVVLIIDSVLDTVDCP